jgi:phenylpyruvate tautomerase PptA (4-oxalocrotonate tautomerase family)
MPYIRFEVNQDLSQEKKAMIGRGAAQGVTVIPGKIADRTMVHVSDRCGFYFHGSDRPIAFVEIRLFNKAEKKHKKALAESLYLVLDRELGIAKDDVYMNIIELSSWGKDGSLIFSENWDG